MRKQSPARGLIAILFLVAGLAVTVAQVAFVPWLRVWGAVPDLLVATTVALALHFGPWAGLSWGLGVGLFADVLAAHPLGILALPLALVGYAAGWGQRLVLESRVIAPVGVGLGAGIAAVLLQIPMALMWGYPVPARTVLTERVLPAAAYTALLTWLCFLLLLSGHRLRRRERLAL